MKVKDLIKQLQAVEDKNGEVEITLQGACFEIRNVDIFEDYAWLDVGENTNPHGFDKEEFVENVTEIITGLEE